MSGWMEKLKEQAQGLVVRGRNLGKGFFLLKADCQEVVRNILLLTPFRSRFGLCVFQRWVPDFDPSNDFGGTAKGAKKETQSLIIPTWITLRHVREEFMGVAKEIAAGIGEVLGVDESNDGIKDPRFCVGLPSGGGWEHSIQVTNAATSTTSTVLVDYNYLPIRCRVCGDTTHCLKDCTTRVGHERARNRSTPNQRQNQVGRRATPKQGQPVAGPSHEFGSEGGQARKQLEVDDDGFQQQKHKGWRRPGPSVRRESDTVSCRESLP
jgi:hypothetical protein